MDKPKIFFTQSCKRETKTILRMRPHLCINVKSFHFTLSDDVETYVLWYITTPRYSGTSNSTMPIHTQHARSYFLCLYSFFDRGMSPICQHSIPHPNVMYNWEGGQHSAHLLRGTVCFQPIGASMTSNNNMRLTASPISLTFLYGSHAMTLSALPTNLLLA